MKIKNTGFTLIEFIFVIILFGIISAIASQILMQGFRAYQTSKEIIDANWQGQIAFERMVREIRSIRSSSDITVNSSSNLTFIDTDGVNISYSISGNFLMRNSQILADGVSSLVFSYQDINGNTVSSGTSTIRYITISLSINKNNNIYNLNTSVYLRNLTL